MVIKSEILVFSITFIKKLFQEKNKVSECCLKLERWQGPPHINNNMDWCCPLRSVLSFSLFSRQ